MTALVVGVPGMGVAAASGDAPGGDPEAVHARTVEVMKQVTERIGHYRGIVQTSTMGRLLAVFGADRSHDDDSERAVRAALDVVRAEGAVRAGVATGEVVVTSAPSGPRQAVGDVIHLALTLEQTAEPGGVLVSATTRQATSRALSFEPVAPAGGLEQASGMRLWRAVEPRSRTGAQVSERAAAPLVERDRELAFLTDVIGRFLRDRLPQSVTLVSDPGLGKSRLVDELSRMVDHTSELVGWRVGHARAYGQGPLGALVEIVKSEVGVLDDDDGDTTRDKLGEVVTGLFGGGADTITKSLSVLLGVADTKELSTHRESLFDDWARFLAAVAERRPLVMVCEDLQWADPALLEFAGGLPSRVGAVPLLLVATARPELLESPGGWGGGQSNAVTLTLPPLSREGTGKLLDVLLADTAAGNPRPRKDLSARTREDLLKAAGGNPLYVEEYVHMLAGRDADGDPGGDPADRTLSMPTAMPTSVQQVIAARIDTLPDADKRLLQDAAVVGEYGWVGALKAVSGRVCEEVTDGFRRLEWRDLLRRARVSTISGETEYSFRHSLIREVAYSQLLREERADKHQRAAAWLESLGAEAGERAELLAHHYSKALELAKAARRPTTALTWHVRRVSRMAGDRAARIGAFTEAARSYRHAVKLCPDGDAEYPALLLKLARAMVYGEFAGAEILEQAREAALARNRDDLVTEVDALRILLARTQRDWDVEERTRRRLHGPANGRSANGRSTATSGLKAPTDLKALGELAVGLEMVDRHDEALKLARQLIRAARRAGLPDQEGSGLSIAGRARILSGDLEGGLADVQQGTLLIDTHHFPYRFIGRNAFARALWWYGDLERCAAAVEEGRRMAAGSDPASARWFEGMRVALAYAEGNWDEAMACAEEALETPPPGPRTMAECLIYAGAVNVARGEPERAVSQARAARESINPNDVRYRQITRALEGRALLATGLRAEAVTCLEELLADQREHPAQSGATVDEAVLLLELGYPPDALPEGLTPTRWHQAVRALAGRDFERAAESLERIGSSPDAALARGRMHAKD